MATHQLTTTDSQEKVILYRLRVRNAERAAQTPPLEPLTVEGLISEYLDQAVLTYADAAQQDARDRLVESFEAADPSTQATVTAALGLDS